MSRKPASDSIVVLVTLGIVGFGYVLVNAADVPSRVIFPIGAAALIVAYLIMGATPPSYVGSITRRDRPVLFWFTIAGIACCFLVGLGAAIEGVPPSRWWSVAGVIVWVYGPVWGLIERDRRAA